MQIKLLAQITILSLATTACSVFKTSVPVKKDEMVRDQDYVEYYRQLGDVYLNTEEVNSFQVSTKSQDYIKRIYSRLVLSNELLFNKDGDPKVFIIKNNSPFLFSLPGENFYYSTGLIEKYLKSEELFIATLAAEIVKSKKNIYKKQQLYPLGFVTTEKILELTRINFEFKKQLNEWSYIVLKRAGYDASAYLNWIQVQNRNSLDFSLYLGESINISNEEQAFKNFMSKQGIVSLEKKINESNSSKDFYEFLKDISKGKNEARTIRKNTSRRTIQKNN